jgi:DNA (cytosine-5)-methyltransferase 1
MTRPRLLDLFCGAGGAAVGYSRAGFEVVGVDIRPQPRYPFRFIQGDALDYIRRHGWEYDAVHASPPCQRYSIGSVRSASKGLQHPDLVGPCRDLLQRVSSLWVIENVIGAPLRHAALLCGTMFGLRVFRHRLFEASFLLLAPPHRRHDGSTGAHRGYTTGRCGRNGYVCVAGHNFELSAARRAMGIDWVATRAELAQAVPPAYTEYLGRQLRAVLEARAV